MKSCWKNKSAIGKLLAYPTSLLTLSERLFHVTPSGNYFDINYVCMSL